jgi:hypothetical protein
MAVMNKKDAPAKGGYPPSWFPSSTAPFADNAGLASFPASSLSIILIRGGDKE